MNCLLWKGISSVTLTCQTIRPTKRVHSSYQESSPTQLQFWNTQSPASQGTGSLAPQTKTSMGGRSRTQAAHQMFLTSLLSSISQWDTTPNSTVRWNRIEYLEEPPRRTQGPVFYSCKPLDTREKPFLYLQFIRSFHIYLVSCLYCSSRHIFMTNCVPNEFDFPTLSTYRLQHAPL